MAYRRAFPRKSELFPSLKELLVLLLETSREAHIVLMKPDNRGIDGASQGEMLTSIDIR